MKYALFTLFYLLLFNLVIYRFSRFQFRNFKPIVTSLIFNLKFLVGIALWFIYTFYYSNSNTSDIYKFYNSASLLHQFSCEHPLSFVGILIEKYDAQSLKFTSHLPYWNRNFDESPFNENHLIIKLNALMHFLPLHTYFVHVLFFCFASLIGWVLITNSILKFISKQNSVVVLPVLLLPSVLLWTSGILKEPLLILGIGLILSSILDSKIWVKNGVKFVTGVALVLLTKFIVLACLLPAAFAYLLHSKLDIKKYIFLKYGLINVLFLLLVICITIYLPQLKPLQILANKQAHAIQEATYFKAGSRIEITKLTAQPVTLVKASFESLWNTIFRPYLWEANNMLMLINALENILIIVLIVSFMGYTNWIEEKNLNLFLFLLNFCLLYFALIGIITPVLGNLVRYKVPLLPILLFAFIIQLRPLPFTAKFSFLLRKN